MDRRSRRVALGGAALALLGALAARTALPRFHVEGPHYTVEGHQGALELRRYAPRTVAETTVDGTGREAMSEGFRRLAGYIFGANTGKRSIAMTTPVEQEPSGSRIAMTTPVERAPEGDRFVVRFTMPSGLTPEKLPRPSDARVRIATAPPRRVAALRFSGTASDARIAEEERRALEALQEQGLAAAGSPTYAGYDPPWTPPFLRRNEILVPLADTAG